MNWKALAAAALLVVASVGGGVAAATANTAQSGDAYAGTHVTFDVRDDAVTDYAVDGTTVVESVKVQSKREAQSSGSVGVDASLRTVTSVDAAGLSVDSGFSADASTRAVAETDSGARLTAHDNRRGVFVVDAGGTDQYVQVNATSDSEVHRESESRVVVEKADGTRAAVFVVGDGEVTVNDAGNVTADLSSDATLVYRQYGGERTDDEKRQERLIANGTAVAEVYYQGTAEAGETASDGGSERAADVVTYGADTTVEVTERTGAALTVTVDRSRSEGKVVLATVSEEAMSNAEDVEVTVDGEAAAEASSYGEVVAATEDGDGSMYLVRQSASAEAATEVAVGIDHFSTREVTMQSGGSEDGTGGDGTDGTDGEPTETGQPGFGVLAVVAAIGAALLAAGRR